MEARWQKNAVKTLERLGYKVTLEKQEPETLDQAEAA